MKIQEKARDFEISKNLESSASDYSIVANPMAFRILFDNLYSDKIGAVVRELSANAYDSHVSAGKRDVPFVVHLPNILEPYFSVIDDGIGMSDEFVRTQFVRFFLSDKTHTNDQTGCMGLGSKSPFAYTDSFLVISRYNGIETYYNPVITAKSMPSIVKLDSNPTSLCNGVEVRLTVKAADFYKFESKATEILSRFKTRPKVVGIHDFNFDEPNYIYRTDRYGILPDGGKSCVVMGNIAYRFCESDIDGLSSTGKKLVGWGIDLLVDVGEMQVTPSRESLSFDSKTSSKLKSLIDAAVSELVRSLEQEVSQAASFWQARCAFYKSRQGIFSNMREFAEATWNGREVTSSVAVSGAYAYAVERRKGSDYSFRKTTSVPCNGSPKFLNDMIRGGRAAILRYLNERDIEECHVLCDDENMRKLIAEEGLDEVIITASSLPKLPPVKRQKAAFIKASLYLLSGAYCRRRDEYWKDGASKDVSQGGVYVEMSRFSCKGLRLKHPEAVAGMVATLREMGHKIEVYGVKHGDVKRLLKAGNWIHLRDYIEDVLAKGSHFIEKFKLASQCRGYGNDSAKIKILYDLISYQSSPLRGFLGMLLQGKIFAEDPEVSWYAELYSRYNGFAINMSKSGPIDIALEAAHSRYPLLRAVGLEDYSLTRERMEAIAEYVNMIDISKSIKEAV